MGKQYIAPGDAYSIVIPDEWEYSPTSHSMAFYNPDGVGALTISCMRSPNGDPADPELVIRSFLPKSVLKVEDYQILLQVSTDGKVSSAYAEYLSGDDAWRVWVFARSRQVVTVSYNCKKNWKDEESVVNKILDSIVIGKSYLL